MLLFSSLYECFFSFSIFFRQIFSSSCIFSSVFDRCIFLLIAMPRPLDSSSTTLFYDSSFHCRSFCWLRSLVDKFFVIITANFSISDCCYLAYPLILFMTAFSSLFLDLLATNFSFFLLHFFVSLRSLHFSLNRDASSKNSSWFLFNNAFLRFFLPLSFFLLIAIPRR